MRLTAEDLRSFADALEKLDSVGLDVTQVRVGIYYLSVIVRDDQKEGVTRYITKIEEKAAFTNTLRSLVE